ncbi:MAG: selenium cofactor biosynthesis protein YqeC [Eubacteriales bacterium]|nr:selenium cofactor biosynthesis protein YqeC [Eubacteriales bacterium]
MLSNQITYKIIDRITDYILPGKITSLVGGGGKTSTMLQMAKELVTMKEGQEAYKVIMTTTTRIKPFEETLPKGVQCIGLEKEEGKLGPVEKPDDLKKQCDYLLIEADGSHGLPVKIPASHEPVITEKTDLVIAVMGLSGIGKPIGQVSHRRSLVCNFLHKKSSDFFTEEDAAKIILSEMGLKKGVGDRRYAVILNQADDETKIEIGKKIQSFLPEEIICLMTSYEI